MRGAAGNTTGTRALPGERAKLETGLTRQRLDRLEAALPVSAEAPRSGLLAVAV